MRVKIQSAISTEVLHTSADIMALRPRITHTLLFAGVVAVAIQKITGNSSLKAFPVIFVFSLALYLFYWSLIYPFYVSPLRKIPTVRGCPLWGQFFTIIQNEVGVPNRNWHKEHGPIVRYFFPFGTERLSVADDESLSHICTKNPYNYVKPNRARQWMMRVLGQGILLAEGTPHKHQRKALAPGFSTQSIRTLTPIFWQKAVLLANLWRREVLAGGAGSKSIEVLEWLNRTTLDIIGAAGFGTELDSLEHPETPIREAYRLVFAFDITSRIMHGLASLFPFSKHLPTKMNRDVLEARRIILSKATDIVQRKIQETHTEEKDIIALIIKDNMHKEATGEASLGFETMRDQVMTFLGAGHDTTATAVAWTLHLLSKNPKIQSRLRAEIKQHHPFLFEASSRTDVERICRLDADQLPYLDNVCRESLRYIPPIPMTVRESLGDDYLGGYFVPRGTTTYIHINAIHRLPHFWGDDDADTFDPDRWDRLPAHHSAHNAYMPFLQGPRSCIGRKFAETEMKTLLVTLVSRYRFDRDWNVDDAEKWKMWRLVLRPKDGIILKISLLREESPEDVQEESGGGSGG